MCLIVGHIAIFIFGLVALIKGNFTVLQGKVTRGIPARIVGLLLMATPVLAYGSTFVYGLVVGMQAAAEGRNVTPAELEKVQTNAVILALVITVIGLIIAFVLALVTASPPRWTIIRPDDAALDDDNSGDRPWSEPQPGNYSSDDPRFREDR